MNHKVTLDYLDTILVDVKAPVPVPVPVPTGPTNCLGLNLAGPDEWNSGARAKIFNDVGLTARFTTGDPKTGPSSWLVLTVSNILSYTGIRDYAKIKGTYTLKVNTFGTVTAANATVKKLSSDTYEIVVPNDNGDVILYFSAALVGQPKLLRNANSVDFTTPIFREFVKPFSFIRFMDLMVTNWRDEIDAAERAKALGADNLLSWAERPDDTNYHRTWGISLEAAVKICNETKKDLWLNISHVASIDWLTFAADYILTNLDPTLNVYLEFSNETWNYAGGFYHSHLIIKAAKDYVASGKTPALNPDNQNDWYLAQRYSLMKLKEAATIFSSKLSTRVKPIFACQHGSGFFATTLAWSKRTYGNNDWLYGLAGAPYIWATDGTPAEMQATLRKDFLTRGEAMNKMAQMRGLCDAHLKNNNLFFYEIGIDMGQSQTNLANKVACAYDAGMETLVYDFLKSNFAYSGAKGAAWFQGCTRRDYWGPAWGLTDDAADLTQPMYKGAVKFASTPATTGGVTAEFFKDTNFTTLLEKKIVPLINHAYIAWTTSPLHHGQGALTTEPKDGSIRFTGKFLVPNGIVGLVAECEANDSVVLTTTGTITGGAEIPFKLDYKGIFGGTGQCFVRLMMVDASGKRTLVTQEYLKP